MDNEVLKSGEAEHSSQRIALKPAPAQPRNGVSASWLAESLDCLRQLASYKDDWNSYGAEAPNPQSIFWAGEALRLLKALDFPKPRIGASSEGGIGINYHRGDAMALIEFYNTGEIAAVISDGGDEPEVWDVKEKDQADLERALLRFRRFLNI